MNRPWKRIQIQKQNSMPLMNNTETERNPEGIPAQAAGRRAVICIVWCMGILTVLVSVFWIGLMGRNSRVPVTSAYLDEIVPESINKIMIVAHPDDETFWGGAHLALEPYFVVCLTCGDNGVRKEEFEQAVLFSGSVPLIMEYPDIEFGIRSRWTGYMDDIAADLAVLLKYKDWEEVVTHNPQGEYGHIQHKMTSRLVTREAVGMNAGLYYFGVYYTPKQLKKIGRDLNLPPMQPEGASQIKQQMTEFYRSQQKAAAQFNHMFPYEQWYDARESAMQ